MGAQPGAFPAATRDLDAPADIDSRVHGMHRSLCATSRQRRPEICNTDFKQFACITGFFNKSPIVQ
ncbi:hypothetical protein CPI83_30265 (plasmid) [Rhodococcus sp. H-CA8f]|nr:hypothetical protein CPI83_30265 [Rhodococcus sp. H-CA8f]